MTQDLPRKRVLRGYGTFTHILRTGSTLREGSVKLWYAPSRSSDPPQIGFAITGTLKNAVARNRVKRCLREAVRLHQNQFFFQENSPLDIIFMYVGPAVKRPGEIHCRDLERQVVSAMKQLMVRISSQ